ncbi:MAG: ketosteroid isomerase [Halobacteriales archaeon SW_8_66_22]|nr:MAG: ketosteroid isomerase [Halobacteriales archaeon SW_8_66_22]
MTARSPESVVRSYYEYVDAEQYEDLVACFAEDIRYERPGQPGIEGREALRSFYLEGRPLDDGSHEIHDVVVNGNTVAVRGSFSGLQDGREVSFGFADFHELDDGEIVRRYTFTDRDEV